MNINDVDFSKQYVFRVRVYNHRVETIVSSVDEIKDNMSHIVRLLKGELPVKSVFTLTPLEQEYLSDCYFDFIDNVVGDIGRTYLVIDDIYDNEEIKDLVWELESIAKEKAKSIKVLTQNPKSIINIGLDSILDLFK